MTVLRQVALMKDMPTTRPALQPGLSAADFEQFYWLKSELLDFCRAQGLSTFGGKLTVAHRIAQYLHTGVKTVSLAPKTDFQSWRNSGEEPTLTSLIPPSCRSDERHRAFFRQVIGPHFRFTVGFSAFLRAHAGATYTSAVAEWEREHAAKKAGKKTAYIAPQFEYNQFVRDFRAANPGRSLAAVIAAWKRRRDAPGANKYQPDDAN